MCGFLVWLGTAPQPLPDEPAKPCGADPTSRIANALELLHHRGPDDTVVESVGPVTFGFKRLAVVDPTGSRQPLSYPPVGADAGRWTLVFNGEIYNHRDLRRQLQQQHDAQFTTHGDAEVLAAAWHYWGPAALPRLRGMFSFVLWDSVTGELHAARDPFGIKPLHHLQTPGGLLLASEKKALMPFAGDGEPIDQEALSYYLTLQYVPEPYTLHRQIRRLQPGCRLTFRPGDAEPRIERYFQPDLRPAPNDPQTAIRRIRDALRESVRVHLVADVPVGAFLSGGIDSTAVVALAREFHPGIQAFTAGFDSPGYSEVDLAVDTASQLGVTLTPTIVSPADVIRELPRIVWHLDDPVADPSLVPLYFLARTAAERVTVVLSGEGADELFAGYRIYREPASLATVAGLPGGIQRGLRAVSRILPEGVKGKSFLDRATTPIETRYYGNARIFNGEQKDHILRGPTGVSHTELTAPAFAEAADLDDVATMQYVDLVTWLPGDILTKADRMSMAHSLELRVPFLDEAVYAAAATLPTNLKLPPHSRVTKYALREAMRGIVPDSAVDRPKLGFPTPVRVWLHGEFGDWVADIFDRSGAGDLLDLQHATALLTAHRRGRADNSRKLWTVLTFCLWHAITVERSIDPGRCHR